MAERVDRDAEDLLALGMLAEDGRDLLEPDDGRNAQGEALDHWDGDVADEAPRADPREADEDQPGEDAHDEHAARSVGRDDGHEHDCHGTRRAAHLHAAATEDGRQRTGDDRRHESGRRAHAGADAEA